MISVEERWTPLTDTQRERFEQDGFLIVRRALDPDTIDQLITAGDRLLTSDRCEGRQRTDDGRTDGFRNLVAAEPAFLPLLTWPTTFPLVVQLMGPHIQLHTSHQIWRRPDPARLPTDHRSPGWHRDIANVTRDLDHDRMPRLEIKVAFFLSDCSRSGCGQTLVAAGSHRWREPWQRPAAGGDPPGAIEPLLAAGDALLFENRTWHAGGRHSADHLRQTVMLGYSHRWLRPDDYEQQAPDLLARCDRLQRCLLQVDSVNRAPDGSFRAGGSDTELTRWAAAHGCTGPACH